MKRYFVGKKNLRLVSAIRFVLIFSQNSQAFLKNWYFIVVSFKNWLKYYIWLLWCKVCPSIFEKKPNFQNGRKSRENRTNMDIMLPFLAKPLDKHGITLVHITYLPLKIAKQCQKVAENLCMWKELQGLFHFMQLCFLFQKFSFVCQHDLRLLSNTIDPTLQHWLLLWSIL